MIFLKKKKMLSALLSLTMIATMIAGVPFTANAASAAGIGVSYQVYGQSYGWNQPAKADGVTAGTTGKSKKIEAIKINLTGGSSLPAGASIIYQVHGQAYGWSQSAKANGKIAGEKPKRIDAIRISLKNMAGYKVTYCVHQQSFGWSDWKTTDNGTDISKAAVAGVVGKSKMVEAVKIKLVKPEIKTTMANVGTAAELNAALADSNIDTINLTANITASPNITRPLTMNFGAYTITGDVLFSYTSKGTSVLNGNPENRIIGNLTVDTANASFKNSVKVSGKVNIANVEIGTWAELATGNMIFITDPDGSTIDVTGHPVGVEVTASASGSTTIGVGANATVDSLTSSAPVAVAVAAGGTVTTLIANAGARGSTITNNGTIGTLTAGAPLNLVANVVPGKTVTVGSGNVAVTGSQAGSVIVTNGSGSSGGSGSSNGSGSSGSPIFVGGVTTATPTKDGTGAGATNIGKYTVGTSTGTLPYFSTVITGTQPLVDVVSANSDQGTAKWVGVLVTTDKDVTSLAVKTPGMNNFQNLGQSDVAEAQAAGASGTKTFVLWLKSEDLTTSKNIFIKVQSFDDITAVDLRVSFAAYIPPIVVGGVTTATPTKDGTGAGATNIGKYTVGTAAEILLNLSTTAITGTQPLVDVVSPNSNQGTAKWVGVLVTTDKDVTSLAVKTPGMNNYQNLGQSDVAKAQAAGASGTKTFVLWLKSEDLTTPKFISIKVQGQDESTAFKLRISFTAYIPPIVVGGVTTATPTKDGTGTGATNIGKYTVGTATGTLPNLSTVITGTQPLVDVVSANSDQGTAKWVGVLVTTDKDVTSLAVKTPGMNNYQNLGQSDVAEAQAAGASGTKTFVLWLKSEALTSAKSISIKVQGQDDSTAVNLSVSFAAYIPPIVGGVTTATPTMDGTGAEATNIGKYTVGQATGTAPNFSTVIAGMQPLVDVVSANSDQGTAKWVGVLVTTDKDVTSLAVKTPGMNNFQNLGQSDVAEAQAAGASGTKTFVLWLKSEALTSAKSISIKVQGQDDSTAVNLSVSFAAYIPPIVSGVTTATPSVDGTGAGATNIGKYTVGQATGTLPNLSTVITGTQALVDVVSANSDQGTAKWVGVLVTTDKDVTSLAVKTPGMDYFENLGQSDVAEAQAAGASGTKTFVWWLKSDALTSAKSILIKVQGQDDSTAVNLSVLFAAYSPVVGGVMTATPSVDGTGTGATNIGKYAVGQATGTAPNFSTVITGTQPLVDVVSANSVRGTAKWVGVLVTTDKDVTSLAVKTPGMDYFQNLGQSDIAEAQAAGASGTKTFVWWLKSDALTSAKSILIKVQGQDESTAANLSVSFE